MEMKDDSLLSQETTTTMEESEDELKEEEEEEEPGLPTPCFSSAEKRQKAASKLFGTESSNTPPGFWDISFSQKIL